MSNTITEEQIMQFLGPVNDPELHRDLVSLGFRDRHDSRLAEKKSFPVKDVIAIGAGKGGEGKSSVAVNLTVSLAVSGADIYGPNVPFMLGGNRTPSPGESTALWIR